MEKVKDTRYSSQEVKGWTLFADKLRELGIKGTIDERKNKGETKEMDEHGRGKVRGVLPKGDLLLK